MANAQLGGGDRGCYRNVWLVFKVHHRRSIIKGTLRADHSDNES
jgi:hypothetical protein